MRNFKLVLWHILAMILIVTGAVLALAAGLQALFPEWQTPWIWLLVVFVATDGVLTQWLVERERRSLSEQGAIRAVEVLLLVISVRIVSLAADAAPLQSVQPWLRDPLAFFGGRFPEYALIALVVWLMATLLTHALMMLHVDAAATNMDDRQIEKALVLQDHAQALEQFDKLWMIYTGFALVGAALVVRQMPLSMIAQSWRTMQPLLAVLACMVGGLLLHSQGHLYQQRFTWQMDQVKVEADVSRRWHRATWLLLGVALIAGILVGSFVHYAPPLPPLAPVLGLMMALMALVMALVVGLLSLLILPFAWLMAWLAGESPPSPPVSLPPPPPQIVEQTGERPLLPALIFWSCVALLVSIAVLRYLQQRQDLRNFIGQWRGWRWLIHLWDETWADLRGWGNLAWQMVQRNLRHPRRGRRALPKSANSNQARLRALYRQMVRAAAQHGITRGPAQTPYEFTASLVTRVPTIQSEAQQLTDAYVNAEYSPDTPTSEQVRSARQLWRRIEHAISRVRRQH
jgi:hypothetical protein